MTQPKDWLANSRTISTIGAHNYSTHEREERDFYATPPIATECLLQCETFTPTIWEPACGVGSITNVLTAHGYNVRQSDIVNRIGNEVFDFLSAPAPQPCDVVTNPPYKDSLPFVQRALENVPTGGKVAMLLRLQWLEGIARRRFFDAAPPIRVHVFSHRITCAMNAEFEKYSSTAVAFMWAVWVKGYQGRTTLDWIN